MRKRQKEEKGNRKMVRFLIPLFISFMFGCSGSSFDRIVGRTISFFSPRIHDNKNSSAFKPVHVSAQMEAYAGSMIPDTMLDTMTVDTVKDIYSALNWETITYESRGKQDPFKPLISKETISQGLHPDQGELVGVIWGPHKGYIALVKEKGGSAFVLQEGDKVVNGYVEKIDRKSIIFRMNQFGVTSKIVLHLKEGKEGEGGK